MFRHDLATDASQGQEKPHHGTLPDDAQSESELYYITITITNSIMYRRSLEVESKVTP